MSPPPGPSTPTLNIQLGGINLSLGGGETGIYRTSGEGAGISVQADGIRDGVIDGVRGLIGKVKQGAEMVGLQ